MQQPAEVMEVEIAQETAGLADPMVAALIARQRWHHVLIVAEMAIAGRVPDRSMGQVVAEPYRYAATARRAIGRLTAWIDRNQTATTAQEQLQPHRIYYADLSLPTQAIR